MDPRTPCIIGVAQNTHRAEEGESPEPLDLWVSMTRAAARDSGGKNVIGSIDSVRVIYPLSWQYDDAPRRLAERLGLGDVEHILSGFSGTSPQQLVSDAAARILVGELEMAVVASGEALDTKKRLKRDDRKPDWSFAPEEKRPMPFADPFHPAEIAHQVFQAYLTFAIFDVARRAHHGLSPDANRQQEGELLSQLTQVAAKNPNAWFQRALSADEIITIDPANRMVAYPYTKNMMAIMDVDMAAAMIVTSHEKADALGVPKDRRVSLRGWAYGQDPVYVAEREDLWRSVAMEQVSQEAMRLANVGIDDIEYFDLYSCFASSVNFARDALGLGDDDTRALTVTGGLPFFGGAGSGYTAHSIVSMVETLRADSEAFGMLSGVGMHMQNHAYGIYSATPGDVTPPDGDAVRSRISANATREIRNTATGAARIAAYSVVHARGGESISSAVCDLPDGGRCYARVDDTKLLIQMEEEEWVGRDVELIDGGNNVNLVKV